VRDIRRAFTSRASKLATMVSFGGLLFGSLIVTGVPAAAASGIGVYVGYADSTRANATNFPTPWVGSPTTIYEGCAPVTACVFDAGGVRIVNNTGASVTVDAIAVTVGSCTFTGWPSAVLPAGWDLIVTQVAPAPTDACAGPAQFDTSDIGLLPNCAPNTIVPAVDVTINQVKTTYLDSGQVLNTGGFDTGGCTGNESTQWTVIGYTPCRGSLLGLAPTSQSHPVLSMATVTATFTNSCGQPLSNVAVSFAATAGPNAGLTGSGVTDANGQASFTYSSSKVGTDTVHASVTNLAGTIASGPVSVTWTVSFAPGGGAFVIGDLENGVGKSVTWWGAQWWKVDPMRSGLAPAAFKGFELSNASPWCGQTWTTRPGNSPHPPAAVPSLMAVIVSSHITKRGPVISGDIVHIVLVHTNPGYGPNPGHRGIGTIIATLC
jgi:hypothetical protein